MILFDLSFIYYFKLYVKNCQILRNNPTPAIAQTITITRIFKIFCQVQGFFLFLFLVTLIFLNTEVFGISLGNSIKEGQEENYFPQDTKESLIKPSQAILGGCQIEK